MDVVPVVLVVVGTRADLPVSAQAPPGAALVVVAEDAAEGAMAADRLGPDCRAVFVGRADAGAVSEFTTEQFGSPPTSQVIFR